jgi:hypothetical protein
LSISFLLFRFKTSTNEKNTWNGFIEHFSCMRLMQKLCNLFERLWEQTYKNKGDIFLIKTIMWALTTSIVEMSNKKSFCFCVWILGLFILNAFSSNNLNFKHKYVTRKKKTNVWENKMLFSFLYLFVDWLCIISLISICYCSLGKTKKHRNELSLFSFFSSFFMYFENLESIKKERKEKLILKFN